MKRITLYNCLCSSSLFLASLIRNIGKFVAKNYFTDHEAANTIHHFKDSLPTFKYTAVIKICKNLSNFPFLSKLYKLITLCWCKEPTANSFQTCLYYIYLLKLCDKSIIILLTNDLTDICREISKVQLILWMVYTCNVKELQMEEDHQWWVIAVDHTSLKSFSR